MATTTKMKITMTKGSMEYLFESSTLAISDAMLSWLLLVVWTKPPCGNTTLGNSDPELRSAVWLSPS